MSQHSKSPSIPTSPLAKLTFLNGETIGLTQVSIDLGLNTLLTVSKGEGMLAISPLSSIDIAASEIIGPHMGRGTIIRECNPFELSGLLYGILLNFQNLSDSDSAFVESLNAFSGAENPEKLSRMLHLTTKFDPDHYNWGI